MCSEGELSHFGVDDLGSVTGILPRVIESLGSMAVIADVRGQFTVR